MAVLNFATPPIVPTQSLLEDIVLRMVVEDDVVFPAVLPLPFRDILIASRMEEAKNARLKVVRTDHKKVEDVFDMLIESYFSLYRIAA